MLADRLVCVFLLTTHACLASGSYIVEVNVHNYVNPTGRCDGCQAGNDPGCCDENDVRPASDGCPTTAPMAAVCDPFIAYCSVPLGDPTCDPRARTDGNFSRLFRSDSNGIDFDAEGSLLGTELPLIIEGDEPWRGLEFVLEPRDCTVMRMGGMLNCGPHFSIDQVFIDIDILVGTSSPEQTYTGVSGLVRFNVSYSVRCAVDHYGADCTRECMNFVSCEGCGLPGLTAEFCQFSTVNCSEVYCNDNQVCVDGSPTCDCEPGFTGDRCEQLITTSVITSIITSEGEDPPGSVGSGPATAAIAGGVAGGVVGLIVISIVIIVIVVLMRRGRSDGKPKSNGNTQDVFFPGDNPVYASGNGTGRSTSQDTNHKVTHLPLAASESVQERDFDNPIYSDDPLPDASAKSDSPHSIYDRVLDDNPMYSELSQSGQLPHPDTVYYSTAK